jgi:hypothetical protein
LLSKSWNVSSAHVPTFTGGEVTPSYVPDVAGRRKKEEEEQPTRQSFFLLLSVHGDVATVRAKREIK